MKLSKWYTGSTINNKSNNNEKKKICIEVPFINNAAKTFKNDLRKFSTQIRPDIELLVIEKPPPSVQTSFNLKDKIPNYLQSDIVYGVKCQECPSNYFGKTIRQAIRRLEEHGLKRHSLQNLSSESPTTLQSQPQSNTTDLNHSMRSHLSRIAKTEASKRITHQIKQMEVSDDDIFGDYNFKKASIPREKSAIQKHSADKHHNFDWDNWNITERDRIQYRLLIKESLSILALKPDLNGTVRSVPLIVFPNGLSMNHKKIYDPGGYTHYIEESRKREKE
ncbi:unnamed protein product [Didymodactylos carnosus]|uniref:Uncharacterized protein n=1 Tax=Didymodactylos carnosus TaxID=1234261 RepID=A0A815AVH2_9BILA|nr:unnamed protein product [Didymodactylos carnosus]CAF4046720.1 unnamed protein product [Didymodactylos carnosus]